MGVVVSRGHHLLFERRNWQANDPNKKLRSKPGLIIPIDHATHDKLHQEIATVPTPNYLLGNTILKIYRDNPDDHLRSIDNFLFATKEAIKLDRVRSIEYQLGDLIISSIEAQMPYIKEGIEL